MEPAEFLFQGTGCLRMVHFGEKDEAGSRQCVQGCPKDPPGQEVPVSKTDIRVNEEDIQIPMKLEMLKAVVQQQPVDTKLMQGFLTGGKSVLADHDGRALEGFAHHVRLVP